MIHILFSSAAGTLRQLLYDRGLTQPIAHLTDALDWGPIAGGVPGERESWRNLHSPDAFGECDWLTESVTRFSELVASDPDRLIWISPRSAQDLSGLYWFLATFGGAGLRLIIANRALEGVGYSEPPLRLSEFQQPQIAQLLDSSPRISWDAGQFSGGRWPELMSEKALLRIVDDGELRSASPDHFDRFLTERCPTNGAKMHRVVAYAIGDIWEAGHTIDPSMLYWRLREMVRSGDIICDGELPRFGAVDSQEPKIRRAG